MKDRVFFLSGILAVFLLGVFHLVALKYHLYWAIWWFDIPMHFLGGLSLGFLALSLPFLFDSLKYFRPFCSKVRSVLMFVVAIGICWEIFEYSIGFDFNMVGSYYVDVAKDLLMDVLGGLVAYRTYSFFNKPIIDADEKKYGEQM